MPRFNRQRQENGPALPWEARGRLAFPPEPLAGLRGVFWPSSAPQGGSGRRQLRPGNAMDQFEYK